MSLPLNISWPTTLPTPIPEGIPRRKTSSSLRCAKKKIRYNSSEFEDANARVYGNTAVIASRVHVKVTVDGRSPSLTLRWQDLKLKEVLRQF